MHMHFGYVLLVAQLEFSVLLQWLVSIFCFVLAMTWWWDVLRKFNILSVRCSRGAKMISLFSARLIKAWKNQLHHERHQQLWQTITKAQCQEESRRDLITWSLTTLMTIMTSNMNLHIISFKNWHSFNLKCNKNCRILNGPLRVRKWFKNGSKKVQKLSKNGQEMVLKWSWNGPEMVQKWSKNG